MPAEPVSSLVLIQAHSTVERALTRLQDASAPEAMLARFSRKSVRQLPPRNSCGLLVAMGVCVPLLLAPHDVPRGFAEGDPRGVLRARQGAVEREHGGREISAGGRFHVALLG